MGNFGLLESIIILIVIIIFFSIPLFLAWYFVRRAKFKERMLLLEKGIDIKDPILKENNQLQFPWLKTGITLIGIAFGLFLIIILEKYISIGSIHGFTIIILFAGLAMIIANFVGNSKVSGK